MICLVKSHENYLEKVAELLEKWEDLSQVKVILPTSGLCLKLQRLLVKQSSNKACLLPKIIPLMNLVADSDGIYNFPKEYLEPMSILEQKILIAKIILEHDISGKTASKISITQSILLATQIIRLFDELRLYGVGIDDLKKVDIYNDAEHWQYMFEFLNYVYSRWGDIQKYYGRVDSFSYRNNILELEIENLKNGLSGVIMAGIIPNGKSISDLSEVVASSKDNFLVVPEISAAYLKKDLSPTDKYYVAAKFASYIPDIYSVDTKAYVANNVEKVLTSSIFEEAGLVTNKVLEWLEDGANDIAIISENTNLIYMITESLLVKGIESINLKGYRLVNLPEYQLFINAIRVFDSDFGINLEKLIILLKSPFLFSSEVLEFEYLIRKNNISSDEALHRYFEANNSNCKIYDILRLYVEKIPAKMETLYLLKMHVEMAEAIAPNLWSSEDGKNLADLLYEVLNLDSLDVASIEEYIEFLQSILSSARVFKSFSNHKVLFTDLEDASIGGYQNIICADLNENSMPRTIHQDPWMSPAIRTSLGLPDVSENIGISWYYFDSILSRRKVLLTRSIKLSGADTVPSRFWLDCNLEETRYNAKIKAPNEVIIVEEKECVGMLPRKISATNLELLIRNPYGFYAKNILNLRKLNDITEPNNLARFGNFLHKVFQDYTNSYSSLVGDKYIAITKIMDDLLLHEDSDLGMLWKPKILEVLKSFIEFDEERRSLGVKVFSEIHGEISIETSNRQIRITAIADRVEIDSSGNIYILDYKTGTLPTKADIKSGIAVQMIVETLIANAGGFKEAQGKVKEIIYVKIASRFPYIETVSLDVSEMDLMAHYDGLKGLLEYYDNSSNFLVNENPKFAPKYDDYKHLARKHNL